MLEVRDVSVVEGEFGPEGVVRMASKMGKEFELLCEAFGGENVGVVASAGSEFVIQKMESSHGRRRMDSGDQLNWQGSLLTHAVCLSR